MILEVIKNNYKLNIMEKQFDFIDDILEEISALEMEEIEESMLSNKTMSNINTQPHYKGKDTIYKIAEQFNLNAYEFDIIKRIIRCRHKGEFESDLIKTKKLIDIYMQETKQQDDLVTFGNYLLSNERKHKTSELNQKNVTHADIENWKETRE